MYQNELTVPSPTMFGPFGTADQTFVVPDFFPAGTRPLHHSMAGLFGRKKSSQSEILNQMSKTKRKLSLC